VSRIALAMICLFAFGAPGIAEPCNPVIDGTYCATQQSKVRPDTPSSSSRFAPVRTIGDDIATGRDQPATLGGITFSGNSRCIGLLRRGACN